MQNHAGHATGASLAMKQRLDRHLRGAVLAKGAPRLILGDRHAGDRAVHPDRPAVQQQRTGRAQRVDKLARGFGLEAEHVDDGIRRQRRDPLTEAPGALLELTIKAHTRNRLPLGGRDVRLALAPADGHDVVPRANQARDEVAADMARGADHDDAAHHTSLSERR